MNAGPDSALRFESQILTARLRNAEGQAMVRPIEVRTHPITGRKCRITYSRSLECEPGTESLPERPPDADALDSCPFCSGRIDSHTPRAIKAIAPQGRLQNGTSVLFPNLYPYGVYSAVSTFDNRHYVEIGTASLESYANSFINCVDYLKRVVHHDPEAVYMAITQNHLPAAGGSLVHPHLQVHSDCIASNQHGVLIQRAADYHSRYSRYLFGDYLYAERQDGRRYIGATGPWHWLAAFAPEGFFEIWAILPGRTSLFQLDHTDCHELTRGVLNAQRFYRSLCRNSYNLGLLAVENKASRLELRLVLIVRANYAPWVRNDITGYEVMLGDMATFTAPEQTAEWARPFWKT